MRIIIEKDTKNNPQFAPIGMISQGHVLLESKRFKNPVLNQEIPTE
jgi:hypothetical protein